MSDAVAGVPMPKYKCHKEVYALKIAEVSQRWKFQIDTVWLLVPEDRNYAPIEVTEEWKEKHIDRAPGYYVVYEDGYTSWSPVEAFESGYTKI